MAKAPDPFTPEGERHYFWKGVHDMLTFILAIIGFWTVLVVVFRLAIPVARHFCGS